MHPPFASLPRVASVWAVCAGLAVGLACTSAPARAQDKPEEYTMVPPEVGTASRDDYFASLGLPDVTLGTRCTTVNKVTTCWLELVNDRGRVLMSGSESGLELVAKGRYPGRAAALIAFRRFEGEQVVTAHFIIDDAGRRREVAMDGAAALGNDARLLTPDDALVAVEANRVAVYEPDGRLRSQVPLPQPAAMAVVSADPDGQVAAVAVAAGTDALMACTPAGCVDLGLALAEHGDRIGVLSAYPAGPDGAYVAVYRYVNAYNKGLYIGWADIRTGQHTIVPLINSAVRNVGFSPQLYVKDGSIVVGARDSTNSQDLRFVLTHDQVADALPPAMPHTDGFEQEDTVSVVLGWGVATNYWYVTSSVEKNDQSYAHVEYDLSDSLANEFQFEGRVGDTRLAVTYLSQKLADSGSPGVETLNLLVDFNDLFAPQWGLRIVRETGTVKGTARYTDNGNAPFSSAGVQRSKFSTGYTRLRGDVTVERGMYFGMEYTDYTLPSALGFADSNGDVVATRYDEDVRLRGLDLHVGYDHAQYLSRYEANYRGLFYSGRIGLGLADVSLGPGVKEEVLASTGKSSVEGLSVGYLALDGELGYGIQSRLRSLRGAGFLVVIGYRARFTNYTATRDPPQTPSAADADKLFLEFDRSDLVHGAFARVLLIF